MSTLQEAPSLLGKPRRAQKLHEGLFPQLDTTWGSSQGMLPGGSSLGLTRLPRSLKGHVCLCLLAGQRLMGNPM